MTDESTPDTCEIKLTQQHWLSIGKHKFALTTEELRSLWDQLNTVFGKETAPATVPNPLPPPIRNYGYLAGGSNEQWPPANW